jgi:acetolactate synthase small subunit
MQKIYEYMTKISKNGVVYYISSPKIDTELVLVKIYIDNTQVGVFIRRVAKLGNRKIITLPHRFNKIWKILHGRIVKVELEPLENPTIENIAKKIVLSFKQG